MDYVISFVIAFVIIAGLFLLLREVTIWYFKIDQLLASAKNTEYYSRKQMEQQKTTNTLLSLLVVQQPGKKIVAISKTTGAVTPVTFANIQELDPEKYDIEIISTS